MSLACVSGVNGQADAPSFEDTDKGDIARAGPCGTHSSGVVKGIPSDPWETGRGMELRVEGVVEAGHPPVDTLSIDVNTRRSLNSIPRTM